MLSVNVLRLTWRGLGSIVHRTIPIRRICPVCYIEDRYQMQGHSSTYIEYEPA